MASREANQPIADSKRAPYTSFNLYCIWASYLCRWMSKQAWLGSINRTLKCIMTCHVHENYHEYLESLWMVMWYFIDFLDIGKRIVHLITHVALSNQKKTCLYNISMTISYRSYECQSIQWAKKSFGLITFSCDHVTWKKKNYGEETVYRATKFYGSLRWHNNK